MLLQNKILPSTIIGAALLCAFVSFQADGSTLDSNVPAQAFTVKLIAFNDFHGKLESPGAFSVNASTAARPSGSADYLAGYVAQLKAQNPLNVVVAVGDLIGASPMVSALFHDEPAVEALNRMGVEFSSVGNHEFDRGAAELLRLQNGGCKMNGGVPDPNSCKGAAVGTPVPFEGAKFQWLSANVIDNATGKPLLPAYGVKKFNGVKVAFVGVTLHITPAIVAPTSVTGLTFRSEAATINALVPALKAQGIEAIIVLAHQGGYQTGALYDINGCDGNMAGTGIAAIVSQLDDAVDMVLSAHTHIAYNCKLPNAKGRLIPVTSTGAFGRVVTDANLTINPATRDIQSVTVTNRLVDRNNASVTPDAAIASIVAGYKTLIAPIANTVAGNIASDLPNRRDGACNMPAGELVADAQLAATQAAQSGAAVISFTNGGGVRSPGFVYASSIPGIPDGSVTYSQAFTVQPFGNDLVTMTLTAQDIKDFLEEQFAGCLGQSATATRFAPPASGFKYAWDGSKNCGSRISQVTLTSAAGTEILVDASGKVLNPAKSYRVTVNSFMADGGDGYRTLKQKGKDLLTGAQDIDVLTAFLGNYAAPKPSYTRGANPLDGGTPRIRRLGSASSVCPTDAKY
jgi:5'-nucleotidase